MWQSEQALAKFLEDGLARTNNNSDYDVIHMEPHVYELVASRQGKWQAAERTVCLASSLLKNAPLPKQIQVAVRTGSRDMGCARSGAR
jgi:hypothetical protein